MNKTRIVLYALTAVVAAMCIMFAACSNDEVIKTNDNINEPTAQIQLSASMEATLTRAADALQEISINTSAKPGIYVLKNGSTSVPADGYKYENIEVTAIDASGNFTTSAMYYPQDKAAIDVYVYAPRQSSPNFTSMPIAVATDQTTVDGYLASDFIYGVNSNVTYPTGTPSAVNVTLKHALCKIKLVIEAGNGGTTISDGDVTEVKLGDDTTRPLLEANVNLTDATLSSAVITSNSGTSGAISFADATNKKTTVSAILPPQTLTNCPLSVKIGTATYTATLSSPDTNSDNTPDAYAAGNEYTYTVKVNQQSLTVQVTSITAWTTSSAGTVDVK